MKYYMKILALLLFLLMFIFPSSICAKDLRKGMPFLTARKSLIRNGWRPVKTKPVYGAVEKILIDAHITEVESCAMDKAVCILNYRKGNKCLRLFIKGEEIKDMYVYEWSNDCAETEKP